MKPKTILVVDDEFYTAEILTFVLEAQGYRVLGAFNGRDALDKLKLTAVDLIILDVMMPIMNGAELADLLAEDETLALIPILVASALSEAIVRDMFNRFNGYLRKPFLMEAVIQQVRALLKSDGENVDAAEGWA